MVFGATPEKLRACMPVFIHHGLPPPPPRNRLTASPFRYPFAFDFFFLGTDDLRRVGCGRRGEERKRERMSEAPREDTSVFFFLVSGGQAEEEEEGVGGSAIAAISIFMSMQQTGLLQVV